MKTMEEQLWDYIDGLTTTEERRVLEEKIATDIQYAEQYKALLAINQLLQQTELEEPSMSFTRNVMEQVALETQPVALKTKVDPRVIYSIAAIFLFGIVGLLIYTLSNSTLSMQEITLPDLHVKINLNISNLVNPMALRIFFCVDVLLALIYLDRLLRTRHTNS
jgi:anti-sigma factor RsiW